jgi:hypothetical protein
MLERIKAEQPAAVAAQHRAGGEHFGVDLRPAREQAMEEPAMPIGPIHHRGDTESAGPTLRCYFYFFNHLLNFHFVSCRTIFGSVQMQ